MIRGATSRRGIGWERVLAHVIRHEGLPAPKLEHVFAPPRRWRFDLAWPDYRMAIEIEGGVFAQGRHTRGRGFLNDMEKYNEAAFLGWRVLRVTPDQVHRGDALLLLKRWFTEPHA